MKRVFFGCLVFLAACDEQAMVAGAPASGGFREQLVIGSRMTFEECKARGGLIIQDRGSPMIACDPHVIRAPAPEDEFDNPAATAG